MNYGEGIDMKKILLCMMLFAGAFCNASQNEEDYTPLIVPQLNAQKSVSFKKSLANQMRSVKTTKYLVYGALALGGFELIRRYITSRVNDEVRPSEHSELAARVRRLEEGRRKLDGRVEKLEGPKPAASTHWIPWIKDKAQAFGRKVDSFMPSWLSGFAKLYLLSEVTSLVWRKIPQIDDYMGLNPTMNWCVFGGTGFRDSFDGYIDWYLGHFDPENAGVLRSETINKKGLTMCGQALVSSMDQVLGYMSYVTEQLKPSDKNYQLLKVQAEVCMEAVEADMKEFIGMMNEFLTEEAEGEAFLDAILQSWRALKC